MIFISVHCSMFNGTECMAVRKLRAALYGLSYSLVHMGMALSLYHCVLPTTSRLATMDVQCYAHLHYKL